MLKNAALVIALVVLPRSMANGINGSRAVRSLAAKSTHSTTVPPISAMIGQEVQR